MAAYVYGVVRAGAVEKVTTPGVNAAGGAVRLVDHDGLAALVSDVPDGPLTGTKDDVLAHSRVLEEAVERVTVLPMRFGVVMPSAEAAEDELLTEHQEDLVAQLDAFEGLVELDLKIVCPEEVQMRAVVAERPDIAQLSREIRGRPADATYYERIRLGELVAEASAAMRDELAELVVSAIEPLAVRTDVGEPAHEQMLLNVAFLAKRERLEEIDRAVGRLDQELAAGMNLKYVGPLPPYRFVEAAIEGAAWA